MLKKIIQSSGSTFFKIILFTIIVYILPIVGSLNPFWAILLLFIYIYDLLQPLSRQNNANSIELIILRKEIILNDNSRVDVQHLFLRYFGLFILYGAPIMLGGFRITLVIFLSSIFFAYFGGTSPYEELLSGTKIGKRKNEITL